MERSSRRDGEGPSAATFVRSFGVSNFILFMGLSLSLLILSCEGDSGRKSERRTETTSENVGASLPGGTDIAGEIFGVPVPMGNYRFCEAVVKIFGQNPAGEPDEGERIWNELVLSYEAVVRRGIEVSREEVKKEARKTAESSGAETAIEKDPKAYEAWCRAKLGVSVEMFENMIEHLVKIRTLRQQVLDGIVPSVSEEEAFEEFLNEHNTLSIELVEFDDLGEAKDFYRKAKANPELWGSEKAKDEKKEKKDRCFKRPGFVALEFLMHMWKIPRKAAYDMIEMEMGALYPSTPIYRGYGVFKILEIRRAKKEDFPKQRESYINQVQQLKKFEGFKKWLKELKEEAKIKRIAGFPPAGPSS